MSPLRRAGARWGSPFAFPSRFAISGCLALLAGIAIGDAAAQASIAPGTGAEPLAAAPAVAPMAAPATSGAANGKVAWYGGRFAGRRTASGERFDPGALTMAHRTLPFGTRVKLTNVANGKSVVVRVNDRGPTQPEHIGDVSREAARRLGMLRSGLAEVEFETVGSR